MARRTLLGVLSACWVPLLSAPHVEAAAKTPKYADPPMPKYRVEPKGFGGAGARDIKAVCDSAGREIWRHFAGHKIEPFVIVRSRKGPRVLFNRNPRGEIVLWLDTGGTYWCQYAYQFAHEFCHILCGFDEDDQGSKWFEETLCETASVFAIRAMARAWADDPPYPHWKDYRHALRKYADNLIAKREEIFEIYKEGLGGFYRRHKARLEKNPNLRDLNGAMSLVFLRLFEQDPRRWEAVRWLNHSPSPKGETFPQYLQKWHDAVPARHKPFVAQVADLYGIRIKAAAGKEPRASTRPAALPPKPGRYARPPMPPYRVVADGFNASARDIKAVCDSAGRELWRYFPGQKVEPFVVVRGSKGPVVLYQRNAQGEIVVRLDTHDTYWSQYAYQFSYLFANILCGFRQDSRGGKWFESTLCQTASLFALRATSKAWERDPPYPHWKSYGAALAKYARNMIDQREKLDAKGLGEFYRKHEKELAAKPTLHAINGAMAVVLLRLFEQAPEHWEAVRWLNRTPSPKGEPFRRYLQRWHDAVPARHKAFVKRIADLYGVKIAAPEEERPKVSSRAGVAWPSGLFSA